MNHSTAVETRAPKTLTGAFVLNFLGEAPGWYKVLIVTFLFANLILYPTLGGFWTGWLLLAEFICTLTCAAWCHPLPAGGLLALEALVLGMTDPHRVYEEAHHNFPVILLLVFMVAGIFFMKELLEYLFTKVLVSIRSKTALSLVFLLLGAFLSAFLDALTVTAVMIVVCVGFYYVHMNLLWEKKNPDKVAEEGRYIQREEMTLTASEEAALSDTDRLNMEEFRKFLCSLIMHGAVGTMLGGVMTIVGEPQNLLIGKMMGWHFKDFFFRMLPITGPVLVAGILTCILVEKLRWFGHGAQLPDAIREELQVEANKPVDLRKKARLFCQLLVGVGIIIALATHVAEVGIIGLFVIVLLTAFNGVVDEHDIGPAFQEALPFTGLLVVFFVIVAVIGSQELFGPIIKWVLNLKGKRQLVAFFSASGLLSLISDNVFVATVYMNETASAFQAAAEAARGSGNPTTFPREQYELIAIAINTGTNIPSIGTPNGQAGFLFLLTSAIAPLIGLTYRQMMKLALPYTVVLTAVGVLSIWLLL